MSTGPEQAPDLETLCEWIVMVREARRELRVAVSKQSFDYVLRADSELLELENELEKAVDELRDVDDQ